MIPKPVLFEERKPRWRNSNNASPLDLLLHDKPAIVCILPNRKSGARCAPCIHHFFVASIAFS
jgi:hypothetical protein